MSGMSKVKLSISTKLIMLITLLVLVIVSLAGVLSSLQTNRVIDDLGGRLKTKVNENLRTAGIAKLELLIQQARIEMLQRDYATLQTHIIVPSLADFATITRSWATGGVNPCPGCPKSS